MSLKLGSLAGSVIFGIIFVALVAGQIRLGATSGDLLDKPMAQGGLHVSRLIASLVLLACITAGIMFIPQRAARAGDGA